MAIELPSPWEAVASGTAGPVETLQNGWRRWTYTLDAEAPSYTFAFAAADFTAAPVVGQDLVFQTRVMNQEVRLSSNGDGPFQWLFGGYYQDRKERQRIIVGA